jgi:hypothetical protein
LLEAWPGRWRIAAAANVDPAVAVAEAMATGRTPLQVIKILIAGGWFDEADSLLRTELEPRLEDDDRSDCLALLAEQRDKARNRVEEELRSLERRARRAGQAFAFERGPVIELAETSVVEARATLAEIERAVTAGEQRRRDDLEAKATQLGIGDRLVRRMRACLDGRHWDAAARVMQIGPNRLRRAVVSPSDVDRPLDLTGLGPPLKLAQELLDAPEALHEKYALRIPDAHASALLRAVLATDPAPGDIARSMDLMLGGSPPTRWPQDDRFPLSSTEIVPVPRPRFLGESLVLASSASTARSTDVVLDVGRGRRPAGPHLGLPQILQIVTANGDRRIALLRVLGPQYPASLVLDDLTGDDLESSLDWAFDLATRGARAPLVDVLLEKASGRPALVEVLFAAALPDTSDRQRLVTDENLDMSLSDPRTRELLAASLLQDLDGDSTAVGLLEAATEVGTPDVRGQDDLIDYACDALELVFDVAPARPEVEAAVARLIEHGYIADADGPDGRFVLELGTVCALADYGVLAGSY